jgi:hypothetical protein
MEAARCVRFLTTIPPDLLPERKVEGADEKPYIPSLID